MIEKTCNVPNARSIHSDHVFDIKANFLLTTVNEHCIQDTLMIKSETCKLYPHDSPGSTGTYLPSQVIIPIISLLLDVHLPHLLINLNQK